MKKNKFKIEMYLSEIMHVKLMMQAERAQKKRNIELMKFFRGRRNKEEVLRLKGINEGLSWIHHINNAVLDFLEREIKSEYPKEYAEAKRKQESTEKRNN